VCDLEGLKKHSLAVLHTIGKSIFYLGPSGSGQKMKLFDQALVAVYFGAIAETHVWFRRVGLDLEDILKVISIS
jgi:3-hydroxyisobutyrate dehydrogenase-like beta-hydroxyacid dehydrogenase